MFDNYSVFSRLFYIFSYTYLLQQAKCILANKISFDIKHYKRTQN